MTYPRTYWIGNGSLLSQRPSAEPAGEEELLHRRGLVRVMSGPEGTEVRWATSAPCFASLFFATEWLSDLPGPYMLRYFLAGWFEETLETAAAAQRRLHQIISRSDMHLLRRVFVKEFDPAQKSLPRLLLSALNDEPAADDYAVECAMDDAHGHFRVAHIGAKSAIARLWGNTPVSYPCQPGGTYDRIVSDAYSEVLRTGRSRYDHVYAAMVTPDRSVIWIPYQRVIKPGLSGAWRKSVRIVSEIAKVDIQII
jgi:hypothetical protein